MKSATTASTEIPQPAIAIPVCPVGTNSDATPRRFASRVEFDRDRHLSDREVGPDREHDPRRYVEVRAGRHVQIRRRLAQVARLDLVLARELDEVGVGGQELVQAVLDVEPFGDARADLLAERRREASARGGDADERSVRVEAERVVDGADDREAFPVPRALRVEQRDNLLRRVAHDAARGLAEMRVAGFAFSEY